MFSKTTFRESAPRHAGDCRLALHVAVERRSLDDRGVVDRPVREVAVVRSLSLRVHGRVGVGRVRSGSERKGRQGDGGDGEEQHRVGWREGTISFPGEFIPITWDVPHLVKKWASSSLLAQ